VKDEAEIRRLIRQWIVQHGKRDVRIGELTDSTPILENGLLSSLEVAELVLYLEHLLGAEIALENLEAEVFQSVDSLWARLFAPQRAGTGANAVRKA